MGYYINFQSSTTSRYRGPGRNPAASATVPRKSMMRLLEPLVVPFWCRQMSAKLRHRCFGLTLTTVTKNLGLWAKVASYSLFLVPLEVYNISGAQLRTSSITVRRNKPSEAKLYSIAICHFLATEMSDLSESASRTRPLSAHREGPQFLTKGE